MDPALLQGSLDFLDGGGEWFTFGHGGEDMLWRWGYLNTNSPDFVGRLAGWRGLVRRAQQEGRIR